MATSMETRDFTVEFFFRTEVRALFTGHGIHKPETGVVARVFIFGTGISQSHNKINTC